MLGLLFGLGLGSAWSPTPRRVSVSGQSAGASMAIQHLFAFSSSVDGAAIAAGSPYGCGAQAFYSLRCYLGHLDVLASIRYARRRHVQHLIDDPVNLRETPVVLFSGKRDWTVWPTVMKSTQQQLAAFLQRDPLVFFNTSARCGVSSLVPPRPACALQPTRYAALGPATCGASTMVTAVAVRALST
jgi:hypothetical protein